MKSVLTTLLLANAALTVTANAAWQRVGTLDKRPVDTASASITGASIASAQGVAQPENLISDDVAASSKIGAGTGDVVLNAGRQVLVEHVSFVNEGAEGRVSVSGSMDQRSWTPLGQSVFTSADRSISLRFAGSQLKYLKLQWDLAKGGSIKTLGVFGSDNDYDFKVSEPGPNSKASKVNVAGGLGGTRVVYINPNPVRGDEIGTKYGRFEFPESPDKFRTVVYDFGQARTLLELGSVHSPRPVRFYAYAFEKDLPEKEDWRGRKSFDPAVFDTMKPVAQAEDARGVGYVKVRPTTTVRTRYLALRWEPDFNPPSFIVEGMSLLVEMMAPAVYEPGSGGGGGSGNGGNGSGNGGNGGAANADNPNTVFMTPFSNPFSISGAYASSAGRSPNGGPGRDGNPNAPNSSP